MVHTCPAKTDANTITYVPEVWEKHVDTRLLGSHGILRGGEAFEVTRRPYRP